MSTASSFKSEAASKAASSKSTEFKFSKTIMEKCCDEAALVLFTPFVVCLASGVLNIESFRYFIAQDVYFLRAFAAAFEIAEDCTDEDDAKNAFTYMRDTVSHELKKFDSFVQDWDSDLIKQSPGLNPATTEYIDFLLAITSGRIDVTEDAPPIMLSTPFEKTRIAPYVMAAVAPCMRFYLAIGSKLKDCPSDHPYRRWVDKYSSTSYEISVQLPEELLDVLCISLTTGELDTVEKIYQHAMRLKMELLNAQTPSQRTVIPLCKELKPEEWHLLLFSAFDLTCSKTDSSATLGQLSIEIETKLRQNQPGSKITAPSSADLKKTWNSLSKKYTLEYLQRLCRALKGEKASKFSYDRLCKALEFLSDFEKRAAGRVINAGILKGVNLEHINKVGELLPFQDGCTSFLREVVQKEDLHVNVHVLSFCWCGDLIRSAFSSAGLQAVNVLSNELVYDNSSVTTGDIAMKFESPFDKIKEFDNICEGFKDNNKKKLTIYIGDSVRDLLCLLKADIGIVIGSDSTLRKMGEQFGASFVPLFNGLVWHQRACRQGNPLNWNRLSGLLYTASSWAEIRAFILGL